MKRLLSALILLIANPALATEGPVDEVCLMRSYDGAHLARHPEQLVTGMKANIIRDLDKGGVADGWYWLKMDITQRGRGPATAILMCQEKSLQLLWCGTPDKYGGGVSTLTDDGKGYFTLRVQNWITIKYTDETLGKIDGVDDKIFKLAGVPCS